MLKLSVALVTLAQFIIWGPAEASDSHLSGPHPTLGISVTQSPDNVDSLSMSKGGVLFLWYGPEPEGTGTVLIVIRDYLDVEDTEEIFGVDTFYAPPWIKIRAESFGRPPTAVAPNGWENPWVYNCPMCGTAAYAVRFTKTGTYLLMAISQSSVEGADDRESEPIKIRIVP